MDWAAGGTPGGAGNTTEGGTKWQMTNGRWQSREFNAETVRAGLVFRARRVDETNLQIRKCETLPRRCGGGDRVTKTTGGYRGYEPSLQHTWFENPKETYRDARKQWMDAEDKGHRIS